MYVTLAKTSRSISPANEVLGDLSFELDLWVRYLATANSSS